MHHAPVPSGGALNIHVPLPNGYDIMLSRFWIHHYIGFTALYSGRADDLVQRGEDSSQGRSLLVHRTTYVDVVDCNTSCDALIVDNTRWNSIIY